ncbi:MAG: flavin reductase [Pseudorhodoplanes sp.]|uniref:flavin reductase n=1 Tax=Pseudorhodoplanes sp. TaxID=1934341 RepID=UPI003D0E8641
MTATTKALETRPVLSPEALAFREGMSRITAAVHIVTVAGDRVVGGVTATAICSVSDAPPTLLVCLHRAGRVRSLLNAGTEIVVNTLDAHHQPIADVFAGLGNVPMADRFRHGQWQMLPGKPPLLLDTAVSFEGQVESIIEAGSHSVIMCSVDAVHLRDKATSLIYLHRRYLAQPHA